MAAPDFAVLDATELPALEPFGLLESLPATVVADAQRWREHLVEVETGLPPDAGPGVSPRAGYDSATTSLAQRQRAKAAELGVALRTVEYKRARYLAQGGRPPCARGRGLALAGGHRGHGKTPACAGTASTL